MSAKITMITPMLAVADLSRTIAFYCDMLGFQCGDSFAIRRSGMKEFEVRDPNHYWLWFGQETDEQPTVQE